MALNSDIAGERSLFSGADPSAPLVQRSMRLALAVNDKGHGFSPPWATKLNPFFGVG